MMSTALAAVLSVLLAPANNIVEVSVYGPPLAGCLIIMVIVCHDNGVPNAFQVIEPVNVIDCMVPRAALGVIVPVVVPAV